MKLFLCSSCNRHVKDDDAGACPFCGAAKRGPMVADASVRVPRMSRSAIALGVSVGAAVSFALVDCSSAEYGGIYPGDAQVHPSDAKKDAPEDATPDSPDDASVEDADAGNLDSDVDG